jgi:histidinol dehydrogenase
MAIKLLQVSISKPSEYAMILNRAKNDLSTAVSTVVPILNDISKRGDIAVREYTKKFDKIEIENFKVEIPSTETDIQENVKQAFLVAKDNIENFHKHQIHKGFEVNISGNRLGIKYTPVESVAVYAPGGKAFYPSSVLMGAIPAKLAGVREINLFTPPTADGKINDILIYVSQISGIKNIYTIGGAQAIGAAGFGTESIPKHDFVVGPGNRYVAAAKAYLSSIGQIGIESIAGPSEVFIIADDTANPEWIACDMLSQAEHGEDSVAILATDSLELALKVSTELDRALQNRKGRIEMKSNAIYENSYILVFPSIEECSDFSNLYAPEHLEIQTKNFNEVFKRIQHAGSVFLGNYSPVAMGDYISGTNHVLPTAGLSRIYSSLGVDTFLKRVTYQEITPDSLELLYPHVKVMSEIEGLEEEHGTSVMIRTKNGNS